MYSGFASVYDLGRRQGRKSARPEASPFDLAMPKLPRLYGEVWATPDNLARVAVHHRIFNRDVRRIGVQAAQEEFGGFLHFGP